MAALKYSRQREAIKSYLCGREDHPTADMIYTSIRGDFPNISLGTVYRNLSLLVELGEIRKITNGWSGPVRCAYHASQPFYLQKMRMCDGRYGTA